MSERSRPSRIVGVLGGMGPAATVDFYDKLVRATPAGRDQDHLRVVIWADPTVPSRQDAILHGGEDPTPWLEEGVGHLLRCGAEILVVACNTIHAYLPAVVEGRDVEFISIIDATIGEIRRSAPAGAIGLLATDGALASGLYQDALEAAGRVVVVPSQASQASLMKVINAVKAGPVGAGERGQLSALLAEFESSGVGTVIAGCTEVSLLLADEDVRVLVIDPAQVLVTETITRARRGTA